MKKIFKPRKIKDLNSLKEDEVVFIDGKPMLFGIKQDGTKLFLAKYHLPYEEEGVQSELVDIIEYQIQNIVFMETGNNGLFFYHVSDLKQYEPSSEEWNELNRRLARKGIY